MGQTIIVEGSIPEDFPEEFKDSAVQEKAKEVVARRLALRPQDKVILNIRD